MISVKQPQPTFRISLLRRFLSYTRPYQKSLIIALLLSVLLAAMAPLRPLLIQLTINKGIEPGQSSYFIHGVGGFIIEMTILQVLLLLLESFLRYVFTFTTAALGQNVVRDLRNDTYSKILQLNLRQFDQTPIGTLTTRTINDIESVNDVFSDGLIPIIADLLTIVAVLAYMLYTDWKITLICLAPFPLLILATYLFKESVNKSFVTVRNTVSQLNSFVQEHLSGMSVIQAFSAEEQERKKFEKINKEHRDANIRAIFAYSVFFPFVELISAFSIGLLVWWAAHQSTSAAESTSHLAGVITSFVICLNLLFRPLRVIADKFNVLQMGMIAGERVFKVLDNDDVTTDEKREEAELKKFKGSVEFKDVSFAYIQDRYVLKNISFSVPAGTTLAIVGHTGSGKTSIISLINRLYHANQGSISIDGKPIDEISLKTLRRNIAVVLQDVFLFSGTIRDNITLHNPDIRQEQTEQAAKLIGMHDFIMRLPGNYDYQVMERGSALSAGQRQLLSFIRALVYEPSILILDEATSSVDTESEQMIQQAIEKMIAGKTAIIIAHRLSTIRKADRILVMNEGVVHESGTHQELLSKKGLYHQLYGAQFAQI